VTVAWDPFLLGAGAVLGAAGFFAVRELRRLRRRAGRARIRWAPPPLGRDLIAANYLKGDGIEIGALHSPAKLPESAKVRYVDLLTREELIKKFPGLQPDDIVEVDVLDNAETLTALDDASQDFVVANNVLEHCKDPIGTIRNMLRVLRDDGILYLTVPDKRYTFDRDRGITSLEHLIRDHGEGPGQSKREHYEEYARPCARASDDTEVEEKVKLCIGKDEVIHFHVWTQVEIIDLLAYLSKAQGASMLLECFVRNGVDVTFALRKLGEPTRSPAT